VIFCRKISENFQKKKMMRFTLNDCDAWGWCDFVKLFVFVGKKVVYGDAKFLFLNE
jgi:hypothetical protein